MQQVKNVMLVDDDEVFNFLNEKFIERSKLSLNVSSYTEGSAALEHLRQIINSDSTQLPEIIFVDIHIPEMDIWSFLDELNKFPAFILQRCQVYALSASVFPEDIEKSKSYKILSSFISKPLTMDKLEKLFPGQNAYA